MFNFEELSEKILKFMFDYDWYNMCDNYGNINTDDDARKKTLEEIYNTLVNNPKDILNRLENIISKMEESDELYNETKELIDELNLLNGVNKNINL